MKLKFVNFSNDVYDVLLGIPSSPLKRDDKNNGSNTQNISDPSLKNNTTKLLDDILNASIDHSHLPIDEKDPQRGRNFWDKVKYLKIKAKMDGFIIQFHASNKMRKRFKQEMNFTIRVKPEPSTVDKIEPDPKDSLGHLDPMQYLVKIKDYPSEGYTGYFAPECCYILDKEGNTYKSRLNPRKAFMGGFSGCRRLLKWDVLDLLYFAGYAVYNYYLTPFIFTFPLMEVREILETYRISYESIPGTSTEFPERELLLKESSRGYDRYDPFDEIINNPKAQKLEFMTKKYRVLEIKFPDYFPTHCPIQRFYVCNEPDTPHYNRIELMEYFPEIGWLISPYFFHFEMDYSPSKEANINLIVPYIRRAYIEVKSFWIKFVVWVTDAQPPGMFGDIDTITYFDEDKAVIYSINVDEKGESLQKTNILTTFLKQEKKLVALNDAKSEEKEKEDWEY